MKRPMNTAEDTGLRGRRNGDLYVDKKVFYNRSKVKSVIKALKDSPKIREHIEIVRRKSMINRKNADVDCR